MRKAGAYPHARQNNRANREIKRLKTFLGRVSRDIRRKLAGNHALAPHFARALALVDRLIAQQRHDTGKLYSLHAPEVECLAKGKAHKKYEFGVKVSVAVTNRSSFVLGMMGRCQAIPMTATPSTAPVRSSVSPARRSRGSTSI